MKPGRALIPVILQPRKALMTGPSIITSGRRCTRPCNNLADGEPVKILELGAGIGTMLERLVDWGILTGPSAYLATDMDPRQLEAARKRLSQWAGKHGYSWSWASDGGQLSTARADVSLRLEVARAEELADNSASLGPFHLIIAHAVLDLVDFPVVLPRLLSRLTDGGLAYFTCNFDGETVFLPHYEGEEEIMKRYHGSMEARLTGASHTGRRLLDFCTTCRFGNPGCRQFGLGHPP